MKVTDSVLRHKTRNLRAKVRSLVPINICCKYEKRNKNMGNMALHRKEYMDEELKPRWKMNREDDAEWFYEVAEDNEHAHMFERLTVEEIEQVLFRFNED